MNDRRRIIIVDDHACSREGLAVILDRVFTVVGVAATVAEVLELVRTTPADCLVADVVLPDGRADNAMNEVFRLQPAIRVVLVTAHPMREHARLCLKAGAMAYLDKTDSNEALIGAVRKALTGGRYVSPTIGHSVRFPPGHDFGPLVGTSRRQREILRLIAAGHTSEQIGELLGIGKRGVDFQRGKLRRLLGVGDEAGLLRYAVLALLIEEVDEDLAA